MSRARGLPLALRLVFALALSLASYALVPHPAYFSVRYGVVEFVRGTATNPFARRVLAPWLVEGTVALTPAPVRARIDSIVEQRVRPPAGDPPAAPGYGTALASAAAWEIVELAAFFLLIGELAAISLGAVAALIFEALTAVLWTDFTHFSVFLYDPLVMALWAGATLAVVRGKPRALDAIVVACAFAKESAIALPLAGWCTASPGKRRSRFLIRTGAVIAVEAVLVYAFRARAGSVIELHWNENLAAASQLSQWLQVERFGPTVAFRHGLDLARPIGFHLLLWAPILALAAAGWRDAAPPLRCATIVLSALALPLQITICLLHEVRDLYELLPWLLTLVALGVGRIARALNARYSADARSGSGA